tara:strand:- start:176 stop:1039 length:864 start_codon:yes stop_codon:yes gene_type:complete
MPKLDSTLTNTTLDSLQSIVTKEPIVVHDTIYQTFDKVVEPADDAIQFVSTNIDSSIPALLILGLIVISISLFVGFHILTNYIAPYLKAHYRINKPYLMLYRIKAISWFIFTLFSFYQLVSSHIIIGFGLTIFVGLLGINFWKDFFAGVYFKIEGRLKIDDSVTIDNISGKIISFYTRNLELITQNDEVFTVPYHKLLNTSVAKKLNKGEERSRTITISVPVNSSNNSIKSIECIIDICPWIYSHKTSSVKKINETDFSVSIYAADNFTFQKVEEFLKQHLKNETDV